MRPVSILDQAFEQKIAALPHDEARASIMEHAIRSQIHERLGGNPAFYESLSKQLAHIIDDLRNKVIDAAEACRRYAEVRSRMRSESDIAAEFGLSPTSFAIYALLERRPETLVLLLGKSQRSRAFTAFNLMSRPGALPWRSNRQSPIAARSWIGM